MTSTEEYKSPCSDFFKIIGVGTCGCNIVKSFPGSLSYSVPTSNLTIIDDDPQILDDKHIKDRYCIEKDDPELNKKIRDILGDFHGIVIVVAGMGGDYSSSIVSEICLQVRRGNNYQHRDCISFVFAVMPFSFENREDEASAQLYCVSINASLILKIDNEPKFRYESDWPIHMSLNQTELRISVIIRSLCNIYMKYKENPVEYTDFLSVLKSGNKAVDSVGRGQGAKRVKNAIMELYYNYGLMGYPEFYGMKNLILNIIVSRKHPLSYTEFDELSISLSKRLAADTNILWNVVENEIDSDEIFLYSVAIF